MKTLLGALLIMVALAARPIAVYPQQAEFLRSSTWLTYFVGGRGTGKTFVGGHKIRKVARNKEPWLVLSPDSGVATETTLPSFLQMTHELGIFVDKKLTPYPKVWFRTSDGGIASLLFRSAEKPEKLRGGNYAGLWMDEASFIARAAYERSIATLRWNRKKMGSVLMTMTPKGRQNWTFEELFDEVDERLIGTDGCAADGLHWISGRPYRMKENRTLIHAHSLDNPFLPPDFVHNLSGSYSTQFAQQELGGEFVDIAGLMFDRTWFEFVDVAPREATRVRYWDKAATPGSGAYTAGVLIAMTDKPKRWYIEDVVRGQWSYLERDQHIIKTAELDAIRYDNEVIIVAEQEGGSAGKEVAHNMIVNMAGFPVFKDVVSGGGQARVKDGEKLPGEAKIRRAMLWQAQAEANNIKLVRGRWNIDYLEEVVSFPESTIKDQVDATSGGFNWLSSRMFRATNEAPVKSKLSLDSSRFGQSNTLDRRGPSKNLYGFERKNRRS